VAHQAAPERLTATKPHCNLGTLHQGDVVSAEFELVNKTRQTLRVIDVLRNCDCASVDLSRVYLEPGARAKLVAKWRIGSARGEANTRLFVVHQKSSGGPAEKRYLK
jgi:hypothetical protein